MFNSPILDVVIGLVFIFLLYSLLATAINEAIASIFGLRARMLKSAISESILSDSPSQHKIKSILKGIGEFFQEIWYMFAGRTEMPEANKNLGQKFFDHPLIKNYGSSSIYPYPSYIATGNFSTVLKDVLKKEFNKRIDEITNYKLGLPGNSDTAVNIKQMLLNSPDIVKIKEIIEYYGRAYAGVTNLPNPAVIDRDTSDILNLHLRNSFYDIEKFTKNIENWFDDSMNRVSGWYKRKVQFILFTIGLSLAVVFNVDTLQISGKLSTDKDARDKLVQMAIDATDKYKDDPHVKKIVDKQGNLVPDTSKEGRNTNDSLFKQYQAQADSIKKFLENDIAKANDVVAIGWSGYGRKNDSACVIACYKNEFEEHLSENFKQRAKDKKPALLNNADTLAVQSLALTQLYDEHWIKLKMGYVIKEFFRGRKFLGFLITAFAISMGAPFWFDLLNKLVRLRAAGKKEDSDNNDAAADKKTSNTPAPVTLNVNTQAGEEAVG